jgi:ABC-type antimicrobial peptide transport system permease subunit
LVSRLSIFFAVLAVVLVATGLYGTLAYKVVKRTSEIGMRMALGAQQHQVLWMVIRESLVLCALGAILGLPLAIAGSRLLKAMLFGIQPGDPFTFVVALLGIAIVALAASLVAEGASCFVSGSAGGVAVRVTGDTGPSILSNQVEPMPGHVRTLAHAARDSLRPPSAG